MPILRSRPIKTEQWILIMYSVYSFHPIIWQIQIFNFNQLLSQLLLMDFQSLDALLAADSSHLIECNL